MKKVYVIGNVETVGIKSAPGEIVHNLVQHLKKKELNVQHINTFGTNKVSKIKALIKIFSILFEHKVIVNVHSFGYILPLIVALISKINKSNKYYLTVHGLSSIELRENGNINAARKKEVLENILFSTYENIIVVSDLLKKTIETKYNRKNKVYVIPNGIHLVDKKEKTLRNNNEIHIIHAGGISELKGLNEMIKFMNILVNELHLNAYLSIYGSVYNDQSLGLFNDLLEKFNLSSHVEYKGKISRENLFLAYEQNDFCIALSKFDTFNMTILEALSVGTPAICNNQVGISSYLSQVSNIVLDDKFDYNNINKVLNENLNNNYINMSRNALDIARQFSFDHVCAMYLNLFKNEVI